jgi:hypothetical protein
MMVFSWCAAAQIKDFVAQPLAPATFGLQWQLARKPAVYVLLRATVGGQFTEIATITGDRENIVDRTRAVKGERVRYRLLARDRDGKQIGEAETEARNTSNIVNGGDFEDVQVEAQRAGAIRLSLPRPWRASIAEDKSNHGRCLQLWNSKAGDVRGEDDIFDSPAYSVGTPLYIVNPVTKYTFSWFTSIGMKGAVGGTGRAYGYRKDGQVSSYARVSNLYIYPVGGEGKWVEYWGEPDMPKDMYYAEIKIWPDGSYQPEPIYVDDVRIIDHDIDLLLSTEVEKLQQAVRGVAHKYPAMLSESEAASLTKTIAGKAKELETSQGAKVEDFFAVRTALCAAIRRAEKLLSLARIADLKTGPGEPSR